MSEEPRLQEIDPGTCRRLLERHRSGRLALVEDEAERERLMEEMIDPFAGGERSHLLRIDAPVFTGRRIPLPAEAPEKWFEEPGLGNIWLGQDGADLLG